jgi:NCS2 family nucleobase:cation symporter-2
LSSKPRSEAQRVIARYSWIDRSRDAPIRRPADLVHGADDRPDALQALLLASQQVALQSVYWLIPALAAAAFKLSHQETMGFICMTLVCTALGAVLHGLRRGPVGSGYALPNVPSPVFLGAYLFAAGSAASIGAAGASMIVAAMLALLLFLLVPRLFALIPPELTGVVVFMIGVSLLPRAGELLVRDVSTGLLEATAVALLLTSLTVMVLVGIFRWPLSRYSVVLGAVLGVSVAALFVTDLPQARALAPQLPWFEVPAPVLPAFGQVTPGLVVPFLIAAVCCLPAWLGDMLTYQRGTDASWVRPDMAPLCRGVVAGYLATGVCGLLGGFGTTPSSACVGLSVATRTYSRRAAYLGAAILLALACSPKLVAAFVMIPGPIAAAMLVFVSSTMLAGGASLMAARVMDSRRAACVGVALAAGFTALSGPVQLANYLPESLVAPVTLAFITGFALHLLTLRLVALRVAADVDLQANPVAAIDLLVESTAGSWGLRRKTADAMRYALVEIIEILGARGLNQVSLVLRFDDGRVRARVIYEGAMLPVPSVRPVAEDLVGDAFAQESFAMWMATRDALECVRQQRGHQSTVELEYQD